MLDDPIDGPRLTRYIAGECSAQEAEESGFAGAGGAEENEKLAFASFEGDIVYGTEMTFFEDFG